MIQKTLIGICVLMLLAVPALAHHPYEEDLEMDTMNKVARRGDFDYCNLIDTDQGFKELLCYDRFHEFYLGQFEYGMAWNYIYDSLDFEIATYRIKYMKEGVEYNFYYGDYIRFTVLAYDFEEDIYFDEYGNEISYYEFIQLWDELVYDISYDMLDSIE